MNWKLKIENWKLRIERSYIALKNLRLRALHGVMPQERQTGGDFLVSVRVGCDVSRALLTDDVTDTLNYARLYELVREEMAVPSALIEHVAGRIGQRIFSEFPEVETADVELTKLNPPMGAECDGASVELHLINDKTRGNL